jgi:hypothetical protein
MGPVASGFRAQVRHSTPIFVTRVTRFAARAWIL